jgi:5-methylcytosine-specific restriction endonuclease McrA
MTNPQREQIKSEVPLLWKQRAKAGLCPVCGKTKVEFAPRMRVYCSVKCRNKYAKMFTTWAEVREQIFKRDGKKCKKCGITSDKIFEINKKKEEDNIKEWIKNNKKRIEQVRARKLVELSKEFEQEYDYLMNDFSIAKKEMSFDEKNNFKRLKNEFEVDHIIAICNGGDMWDKKNMQVLCKEHHKEKTKKDLSQRKINKINKEHKIKTGR